jgi:hypothetical protein
MRARQTSNVARWKVVRSAATKSCRGIYFELSKARAEARASTSPGGGQGGQVSGSPTSVDDECHYPD